MYIKRDYMCMCMCECVYILFVYIAHTYVYIDRFLYDIHNLSIYLCI